MNARQAMDANTQMVSNLLVSAKEMAIRMNITISEAIDHKVKAHQRFANNDTARCAWHLRGEEAKKML